MIKIKTYLWTIAFFFAWYVSFGQTVDSEKGCAPFRAKFTAPDAASHFWDFKDGSTSTLAAPGHIFADPGTYEVEYKATADGPILETITVEVYEQIELKFIADNMTGCAPLEVTFTDTTEYPEGFPVPDYLWTFGDGQPNSTDASPTVTYENVGNYNVGLAIESELRGCNTVASVGGFISTTEPVDIRISTLPLEIISCDTPFQVSFSNNTLNTGNYSWDWDFGNGEFFKAARPQDSIVYTDQGVYNVVVSATDTLNCTASDTLDIVVGGPSAVIEAPDVFCLNQSTPVSALQVPQSSYEWVVTNADVSDQFNRTPELTFNSVGEQEIRLMVETLDGRCSTETAITVNVRDVDINPEIDPVFGCEDSLDVNYDANATGENLTFEWRFGDQTRFDSSGQIRVGIPDTLEYSINMEQKIPVSLGALQGSCAVSFMDTITIQKPNARFEVDRASGCIPLTIGVSDFSTAHEAISNYEFLLNGTSLYSGAAFPNNIEVQDTGIHQLQLVVTTAGGCVDTSYSITIHAGEKYTSDFEITGSITCGATEISLKALNPSPFIDEFKFIREDGFPLNHCTSDDSTGIEIIDSLSGNQEFLLITGQNGCYDTLSKNITIEPNGAHAMIDYRVNCDSILTVEFVNQSVADSIRWIIGDTIVRQDSFQYTFESTGEKMIILEAYPFNGACEPDIDTLMLELDTVYAEFTPLDSIMCPGNVTYDATASRFVNNTVWRGYKWERTWGRPIHTQDSVITDNVSSPGPQKLDLIVFDRYGCTDTASQEFRVFQPTAAFTFDPGEICLPAEVQFTDASTSDTTIVKYTWSFGVAGTSTSQNPTYTFGLNDTDPTVLLEIEDAAGCTAETVATIPLYEPRSVISWLPNQPGFCVGESIDFSATDFTEKGNFLKDWEWNFGNGESRTTQNVDDFVYNTPGVFDISLSYEEDSTGCRSQTNVQIEIQDFPEVDFAVDSIQCFNTPVQFVSQISSSSPVEINWDYGNGNTGNQPTTSELYPVSGTYTAQLKASTSFGCADSTQQTFRVAEPKGDFVIDKDTICRTGDLRVELIDTSDVTNFVFDFGDGDSAVTSPAFHTYNVPAPGSMGTVTLFLYASENCFDIRQKDFQFYDVTAIFTESRTEPYDCNTKSIQFTNSSRNADAFTWVFGTDTVTENNPVRAYDAALQNTEVTLRVENTQFGCTDEMRRTVPLPDVQLVNAQINVQVVESTCVTRTFSLRDGGSGATVYNWDFGNGETSTSPTNNITFDEGTYDVVLVSSNPDNGCSDTSSTQITVERSENLVNIDQSVNAFTPNGDDLNDIVTFDVTPEDDPNLEILEFTIFNRWGKKVHSESTLTPGWDGMLNGSEAPADAYQYFIRYKYADCPEEKVKGDFLIVK